MEVSTRSVPLPYGLSRNSSTDSKAFDFCEPQKPFFTEGRKYHHFILSLESMELEPQSKKIPPSLSPTSTSSSTSSISSQEPEKKTLKGRVALVRTNSKVWRDTKTIMTEKNSMKDPKKKSFHGSFSSRSSRRQSLYYQSSVESFEYPTLEKAPTTIGGSYKFSKNYDNTLEEEFVNKIFYLKDAKQESVFFGDNKDQKNSSYENLDDQRISIAEAVSGYPFVMSTKKFLKVILFQILKQSENKALRGEETNLNDDEKKKALVFYKCLLIFKEWVKNCRFFEPNINEAETIAVIRELFSVFKLKYGSEILKSEEAEIECIRLYDRIKEIESENLKKISDFPAFISFFEANIEKMALELFASTIQIQAHLNSDITNKNKLQSLQDRIGEANNKLEKMILKDIFKNHITDCDASKIIDKKEKKLIIKRKKEKLDFYIKLAEYSHEYGDLFTCLALVGTFNSGKIKNDPDLKLNSHNKQFISNLSDLFVNSNGIKERQEILKKLPVPVFFAGLFGECEVSKERYPPVIQNGEKKSININYVRKISSITSDLIYRQTKTQHIKAQTDFASLLLSQ